MGSNGIIRSFKRSNVALNLVQIALVLIVLVTDCHYALVTSLFWSFS